MDSWKSLLIAFALVGLFAYALLNAGGLLQVGNNVNNSILNSPILAPINSSITNNLNNLKSSSDAQQNASTQEQAENQNPSGALILGSIFSSLGRFGGFLYGFGYSFITMTGYLIHDSMITGVLWAILIIIVIAVFWRFVKWGQ